MKNKGFTLIEAIAVVSLITIGLLGVISLANFVISQPQIAKNRLQAVALVQQQFETMRYWRDYQWISKPSHDARRGEIDTNHWAYYMCADGDVLDDVITISNVKYTVHRELVSIIDADGSEGDCTATVEFSTMKVNVYVEWSWKNKAYSLGSSSSPIPYILTNYISAL
ncbi:MAG: hypothetical protein COU81_02980 [Candidatus Portnoybacteria bacterium CG10_big_fil_rev_8_21_14_0_10_36_7]|uniref:Type II secretion system protein n=1 Tax=Candidatus Portnoybacteria bacterium CG10_big_fil_rev_8_21_14_0_10_36_7 TaxID=1974812 RepID=A0A2M8KDM4_9BACT|nr:MAG: hypothetical protein COU81_02980 [Candidatus Portnoybacteria bacterium CG10_big_fil_rev_8_21_14_0_10_36_7]